MFYLTKLIQVVGFAYVTYALLVGFTQDQSMGRELKLMMVGAGIFLVGRILERKASAER
jgi:hypothetical protein